MYDIMCYHSYAVKGKASLYSYQVLVTHWKVKSEYRSFS
jgi:hypothetical protein